MTFRDATHDTQIEIESRIRDLEERIEKLEAEIQDGFDKDIEKFLSAADLSDPLSPPKPKHNQAST